MKDWQRAELEGRMLFKTGAFTCVYFHDQKMRIGIERSALLDGGRQLKCYGDECVEGGPCNHGDCPYYTEITLLALNNFNKDDGNGECRS